MRKVIYVILLILAAQVVKAQTTLTLADSLFDKKKYTESFELYKAILELEKQSSPSMLLKMAYIKEGLGGYSDALYYLNLYYLQTADKKVLSKMEELSKKRNMKGYEFSDFEFIQTVFYKYYFIICGFILAMSILFFAFTYHLKFNLKRSPILPASFMSISLAILFYVLNFGHDYDRAIINQSSTYMMSGPGAGAEVMTVIDKGNRLETLGEHDVWTKVKFDEKTGYIKTDKLKKITFTN
jgi:uncharacterized protein YgiM (DUF1202 family)